MFRNLGLATILLVSANVVMGQQNCSSSQKYYTPAQDEYIFSLLDLGDINGFDGPTSLTGASITTTTTSMTQAELNYYMYIAGSVYCPTTVKDLTCCYCGQFNSTVSNYTFVNNTVYGTFAMITVHPSKSEVVVTFRGSVGIMNFIADITLLPVNNTNNVKIHRGFYLSLMSIYNEVSLLHKPLLSH